ncbi:hypothetical protein H310_05613 [Aphanomyces invadans]|uniref:Uncharacterized protein n=1 Tax=Aphanomyces invadans TaxID=157072 RepID=A0A024UBC6_9STRA|nr:hypothetical protein H310_05613 [Aphanomyces invadans]ETW03207.1 hypothetical protein H310_05613 [Aphanomyces invadans]|eukprot:XP_008868591.1 hypothetical protein H310_05613 [Aphanomyces invadans]
MVASSLLVRRLLAKQAHKLAAVAPCTRSFSSHSADVWETITRRDGQTVYYNRVTKESTRTNPFAANNTASTLSDTTSLSTVSTLPPPVLETPQDSTKSLENAVVYTPIDFSKAAQIVGQESQLVHITLEPNQKLRAESGAMIYMTDGVVMDTHTAGGVQQGLKRMMTGENFFVTEYTYTGATSGQVCLGTSVPSKIIHMNLADFGGALVCQKGAFIAGSHTVGIEMEFTKNFGAGFFGGQGFILQRLTGPGEAFVRASGALIERTLVPGEVLRISSGCLVAFEPTVQFDIQRMQGVKNVMFGGEGLFVTTLTGPGRVFLQGLPFDRMVSEIASRVPAGGGMMFVPGFGGGSVGGGDARGAAGEVAGEDAATADVPDVDSTKDSTTSEESMFGYDGADAETVGDDPNSFVTEEDDGSDLGDAADGVVDFLKKWF